jgi:hypothetical protein
MNSWEGLDMQSIKKKSMFFDNFDHGVLIKKGSIGQGLKF